MCSSDLFFRVLLACSVAIAAASPAITDKKTLTANDVNIPMTQDVSPTGDDKMDIKSMWAKKFKPTVSQMMTPDGYQKSIDMPNNPLFSGIKINIKPYPGGYISIKSDAGEIIKPIGVPPMMDDDTTDSYAPWYGNPLMSGQKPWWTAMNPWFNAPFWNRDDTTDNTIGHVPLTRQDYIGDDSMINRFTRAAIGKTKIKEKTEEKKDTKDSKETKDSKDTTTTTTDLDDQTVMLSELMKHFYIIPKIPPVDTTTTADSKGMWWPWWQMKMGNTMAPWWGRPDTMSPWWGTSYPYTSTDVVNPMVGNVNAWGKMNGGSTRAGIKPYWE